MFSKPGIVERHREAPETKKLIERFVSNCDIRLEDCLGNVCQEWPEIQYDDENDNERGRKGLEKGEEEVPVGIRK